MIKIGFAKKELTLALRPIQPIREPIEAVAMYIESEDMRALWITLDLMDLNRNVTDTLKLAVSTLTGLDTSEIHVLSTHNHGGGEPSLPIMSGLVSDSAVKAISAATPAMMRSAFTESDRQLNILRRVYIPELQGTGTLYFGACEANGFEKALFTENAVRMAREGRECNSIGTEYTTPVGKFPEADKTVFAAEFVREDGTPIGSIVRFAAHAVCANRPGSYSSDYPYYVRQTTERTLGGVCMFLNGPCADIAPAMLNKLEGRERPLGEHISHLATAALMKESFAPLTFAKDAKREISLPVREEVALNSVTLPESMPDSLPERKKYFETVRLSRTLPFLREKYTSGESTVTDKVSVFIGLLTLGNVTLVAFPGETFSTTARAVADEIGGNIVTVTEHERTVMYMPPYEEHLLGGYEAVCRVTAPNAETVLRSEAVRALKSHLG